MAKIYEEKDDGKETRREGKSGRSRGRRNTKREKKEVKKGRSDVLNDVSWYTPTVDLLVTSSSHPFSVPTGAAYHWDVLDNVSNYHIPGILRLDVIPTIGGPTGDKSGTSAVNLSAQQIYAYIRKDNSGAKNYDPVDVMLYCLAYDNIVMYHEWLKRIYGLTRLFSQFNWYLGKSLIYSMRVDPNSIATNLADFKMGIDMLAARMDMFFVPDAFPIFKRHAYMYQNIYMDDPSTKCQLFYFQPAVFGKYAAIQGNKTYGGLATATPFSGSSRLTYQDLLNFGDDLINAFVTQEDCAIISGDIARAYNASGLIHLEPVPFDYTTMPVYVPELLHQIHNAKVLGSPTYSTFSDDNTRSALVDQDPLTGMLYETVKFPQGYHPNMHEEVLNLLVDVPTPADVMVATRLMSMVQAGDGTLGPHGTEVITSMYIFTLVDDGTMIPSSVNYNTYKLFRTDTATKAALVDAIEIMAKMSNFNFAPLATFDFQAGADAEITRQFYANINNMRVMSFQDLADLHTIALMGEFGVPPLGKYNPSTANR